MARVAGHRLNANTGNNAMDECSSKGPRKRDKMTEHAREGYEGKPNGSLYSSPHYYAHELGAYLQKSGRSEPREVHMGRGYSIRANDMRFNITHAPKGAPPGVTFERVE
jgi:hypothetical protein